MSTDLAAKAVSERLARAAAHPVRVAAFSAMGDRPYSSKEISDMLEEPISNVSYHVRALVKLGLIELVRTEPRRGSVERFYRAVVRPMIEEKEWSELTPEERENCSIWTIQMILLDLSRSIASKALDDRHDRQLTRLPLAVDEQGWRELVEIHARAFHESMEVQARSAARMVGGRTPSVMACSAIALFESMRAD